LASSTPVNTAAVDAFAASVVKHPNKLFKTHTAEDVANILFRENKMSGDEMRNAAQKLDGIVRLTRELADEALPKRVYLSRSSKK
jgi:hypothetical protein